MAPGMKASGDSKLRIELLCSVEVWLAPVRHETSNLERHIGKVFEYYCWGKQTNKQHNLFYFLTKNIKIFTWGLLYIQMCLCPILAV